MYHAYPYFFILFYTFFGLSSGLQAQMLGKPFIKNYPPQIYQADIQNWAVVQDKRGILYFANDKGILEYDGKNWHLISTANNSAVRSLSIDEQGIIYVGASQDFGYLVPNAEGQMQYVSLSQDLGSEKQAFADVWSVQATSQGVFFHTDNFLFRYNPKKKNIQSWSARDDSFFFLTFYVHGQLYVHDRNHGLHVFQDDKLIPMPGTKALNKSRVYLMVPYDASRVLIGCRELGLFLYDEQAGPEERLQKFPTELEEFILESQLYQGIRLKDGRFALCTRKSGVLIMNAQGAIEQIIDDRDGLLDNNVRFAAESREGLLWLALDNGISRVNLQTPIRYWDESNGLEGTIFDIAEYRNTLYVATSQGVYYLRGTRFSQVEEIATECRSLLVYNSNRESQEHLLVGTNDGVYEINQEEVKLIVETRPLAALHLYRSRIRKERVYVGMKGGLMSIKYKQGLWENEGRVRNVKDEIYSIAEDQYGNVWLGTFIAGLVKIKINPKDRKAEQIRYGKPEGLPTLRDNRVFFLNNRLLTATQRGIYQFLSKEGTFVQDSLLGGLFEDRKQGVYAFEPDSEGNIWMSDASNQEFPIGFARSLEDGTYEWQDTRLRRLPAFSKIVIRSGVSGQIWIGGSEGLFGFESRSPFFQLEAFSTLIQRVSIGEDSVLYVGGASRPGGLSPVFGYDPDFSIDFQYVCPFFDPEEANEYRFKLEVRPYYNLFQTDLNEEKWSGWNNDTKIQYSNLWEGSYTFHVQSRNGYGAISQDASFRFIIRPPWYRSLLAYGIYTLLFAFLIWVTIQVYTYRLRNQKRVLEETVEIRTREIREKNQELEKQREEILMQARSLIQANEEITEQKRVIEDKKDDIEASINYASRIQAAMLPRMEEIKQAFPDSFVIYRPRDIVSGDFYWFSETMMEPRFNKNPNIRGTPSIFDGFTEGKKIIAAVDCTGHGVPGAFMSMIGDSILNQIINLEGVTQPHLILNDLNLRIRKALKQDQSKNLDGMDMALCVINPNQGTLEFAGARNPLFYVLDGKLEQIRADPIGIGGFKLEDVPKIFTRHVLKIEKPIRFYIFSDGMQDQFGGPKGKKFMAKRIKALIQEHYDKPMLEQQQILEEALDHWKQGYEQIDDILMIGVYLDPKTFVT